MELLLLKKRLDKEAQEKLKLEKENENERLAQIEKEKLEREKQALLEKDLIQIYQTDFQKNLRESIMNTVTEVINSKVEQFKEETIKKAIYEANSGIEKALSNSSISKREEVHHGIKCSNCFVFPIIGIRYKCNVCNNYDLCTTCEEKLAEIHIHPMTKLRVSVHNANPKIQPNNFIFEELCGKNRKKINKFRPQLNQIRSNYIVKQSDIEILMALYEKNGNIDEALELICSLK
jgi:hypothetical protein